MESPQFKKPQATIPDIEPTLAKKRKLEFQEKATVVKILTELDLHLQTLIQQVSELKELIKEKE